LPVIARDGRDDPIGYVRAAKLCYALYDCVRDFRRICARLLRYRERDGGCIDSGIQADRVRGFARSEPRELLRLVGTCDDVRDVVEKDGPVLTDTDDEL